MLDDVETFLHLVQVEIQNKQDREDKSKKKKEKEKKKKTDEMYKEAKTMTEDKDDDRHVYNLIIASWTTLTKPSGSGRAL